MNTENPNFLLNQIIHILLIVACVAQKFTFYGLVRFMIAMQPATAGAIR